jgi:hypothetical protein
MTIGYGAPQNDVYFGQCSSVLLLISTQTVLGVLVNTCCLGVIFTRLSRGQTRATSIVFSDKAIIRRIRGSMYFMFQVYSLSPYIISIISMILVILYCLNRCAKFVSINY